MWIESVDESSLWYGADCPRDHGHKDTVAEPYNEYEGKGIGFSFAINYNAHEMLATIRYAKDVYYNRKREWNRSLTVADGNGFLESICQEVMKICTTN